MREFILIAIIASVCESAVGYEQQTHAAITAAAIDRSLLGAANQNIRSSLGIANADALSSSLEYFEIYDQTLGSLGVVLHAAQDYENDMIDRLRLMTGPTLDAWLVRGAIREDDNAEEDPPTPQDVSPGLKRPLHHFFDPYKNRALTIQNLEAVDADVHRNPDWAIGTRDSFVRPVRPESHRRNRFSIYDAREAMFRALTLKWQNSNGEHADLDTQQATAAALESWRKAYWATAFRALGDAVHLLQDMAQPQHTRNEPHAGKGCVPFSTTCLGGHTSVFEKYVNARALGRTAFESRAPFYASEAIGTAQLEYGDYPIPAFPSYSDYWSTAPGPGSLAGAGLADYSNRGFFSAKYNLGNAEYPSPSNDPAGYDVEIRPPTDWSGTLWPDGAPVLVYRGAVLDTLTGLTEERVALTSYGLWDQFMRVQGRAPKYTLNRVNYDAMADLLIPRAVAFSAGLINHFFRGRLEIGLPDAGFFGVVDHSLFAPPNPPTDVATGFRGFGSIRLRLLNSTDAIRAPDGELVAQEMSSGTLYAVLKFRRVSEACYDDLLDRWPTERVSAYWCRSAVEEIVVSDPVVVDTGRPIPMRTEPGQVGGEFRFTFSGRQLPINAWDVVLQVVYRGRLGLEDDAVVVATKDISEPTYATIMNITDFVALDGKLYLPDAIEREQSLFARIRPECTNWQSSGGYKLDDWCRERFDEHIFVAGTSAVGIAAAGATALAARRFARFALLLDPDAPAALGWLWSSCIVSDEPFVVPAFTAQGGPGNAWDYGVPHVVRGIRTWALLYCLQDVGIERTPSTDALLQQLDDLTGDERIPAPLAIDGWE